MHLFARRVVTDMSVDLNVEPNVLWQMEGGEEVVTEELPDLSFNPETMSVEHVHRCSVTASGFAEAEELTKFINGLPADFRAVVNKFSSLFQPPDRDPPSRPVKHYICVHSDVMPAARRAYPLPRHKLAAMHEQMRELIDKGWVQESSSPWAAPVLFVPKDGGKKQRMCIDFRDLNALTKKR